MTVKSVQRPQMSPEVLPDDLPTFPLEVGYRYVYNPMRKLVIKPLYENRH